MAVRTRFAPSPTGLMHVGSVRTALFAWAYARQQKGQFILRIEDTDKKREVPGSIEHIKQSLEWLGLIWDEQYLQSDRLDAYREHAETLITSGLAYVDTYSEELVNELRAKAKAAKKAFLFRQHRPANLTVPQDWYGKLPLRFKVPELKRYNWHDEVRGKLSAGEEALDDFVLIKADGYPTYNFAHVVDDQLMKISHVMRGEEFIASTPKFLSLMDAFGWTWPKFATLPPVLNLIGGKKLSKRDGAKDILEYKNSGYLPDAVANFLASLGWNDGTDQEVFSLEEIAAKVSLKRIQRSGAKFDEAKLDWLNWQHYKRLVKTDLPAALKHIGLLATGEADYLDTAAALAVSKSANIEDFKLQMSIFTDEPNFVSAEVVGTIDSKLTVEQARQYINEAMSALEQVNDWDNMSVETALRSCMQRLNLEGRVFLNLIRWAVSGQKVSPSLFDMLVTLGKDQTIKRLGLAAS